MHCRKYQVGFFFPFFFFFFFFFFNSTSSNYISDMFIPLRSPVATPATASSA